MKTNLHLTFEDNKCNEAFSFYEKVFNTKRVMTICYKDAPPDMPVPPDMADKVMHTSMPLGSLLLMGCDAPKGRGTPLGGFQISLQTESEDETRKLFAALSEGGVTQMEPMKTFWSPLFSMCIDKFGVGWMIGMPGENQ